MLDFEYFTHDFGVIIVQPMSTEFLRNFLVKDRLVLIGKEQCSKHIVMTNKSRATNGFIVVSPEFYEMYTGIAVCCVAEPHPHCKLLQCSASIKLNPF